MYLIGAFNFKFGDYILYSINKWGQLPLSMTLPLKIGEKELPCAVLIGGARILTKSAVFRAFERTKRGRIKGEIRVPNMPELPSFIDANNLVPYIDSDLSELLKPITYKGLNGTNREGYKAEIIPQMCDVYLQARKVDNKVFCKQCKNEIINNRKRFANSRVDALCNTCKKENKNGK